MRPWHSILVSAARLVHAQGGEMLLGLLMHLTMRYALISDIHANLHALDAVLADIKHCGCKSESPRQEELAHISYEDTRAAVTPDTEQFLGALKFSTDIRPLGGHAPGARIVLVHGTSTLNTLYWTEDRSDDFCRRMAGTADFLRAGGQNAAIAGA